MYIVYGVKPTKENVDYQSKSMNESAEQNGISSKAGEWLRTGSRNGQETREKLRKNYKSQGKHADMIKECPRNERKVEEKWQKFIYTPRCASWMLKSWQANKLTDWYIDKLTNWQAIRLTAEKRTWWQDDKMTSWQDDKLTRWQDDKMTRWQDDKMTR